jgi:hypothetical protein
MRNFKEGDLFYRKKENKFYRFIERSCDGLLFLRREGDNTQDPLNGYRFVVESAVFYVGNDTLQNRLAT